MNFFAFAWIAVGLFSTSAGASPLDRLALGGSSSCTWNTSGKVVCWGNNEQGQIDVPMGLKNLRQLGISFQHGCALDDDGVWCWGGGGYGQNDVPDSLKNPRQIAVGFYHTCALDDDGVKCW